MKFDPQRGAAICEQCGKPGPQADTLQDMMLLAVEQAGWGYQWEDIADCDGVAHFYCRRCKAEFDCITEEDIPR
jgi:hypothetical protein